MKYDGLTALLTRLAGIFLIVHMLATFPTVVANVADSPESRLLYVATLVVPVLLPLAVGAVLIWLPRTVSGAIAGRSAGTPPSTDEWEPLQTVLLGLFGLYLSLTAVLDLSFYFALHYMMAREFAGSIFDAPEYGAGAVTALLQLVLGVVLLLGARGSSALLYRLRNAGFR